MRIRTRYDNIRPKRTYPSWLAPTLKAVAGVGSFAGIIAILIFVDGAVVLTPILVLLALWFDATFVPNQEDSVEALTTRIEKLKDEMVELDKERYELEQQYNKETGVPDFRPPVGQVRKI